MLGRSSPPCLANLNHDYRSNTGMIDLDLVPTEDLLKALKRRFDHMVFAGSRNIGGDQGEDFSVRSTDHSFATLGE